MALGLTATANLAAVAGGKRTYLLDSWLWPVAAYAALHGPRRRIRSPTSRDLAIAAAKR